MIRVSSLVLSAACLGICAPAFAAEGEAKAQVGVARAVAPGVVGGTATDDAQLKQVARAVGKADLVAVIKVTDMPKDEEKKAQEKGGENAGPAEVIMGVGFIGGNGVAGGPQKEIVISAEAVDILKGDKDVKEIKIRANVMDAGKQQMLVVTETRESNDGNGGVFKFQQTYTLPLTLAKDKQSLIFLKVADVRKDASGKVLERSYTLMPPLPDGAPEKTVAAVKDALKRIAEWENPPKLSADDEAAVKKLIADLGNNSFETREAATKALTEKGGMVRALVAEAAKSSTDAEVKQRAENILEAIKPEFLKAEPAGGIRGTRIMRGGAIMQMAD